MMYRKDLRDPFTIEEPYEVIYPQKSFRRFSSRGILNREKPERVSLYQRALKHFLSFEDLYVILYL